MIRRREVGLIIVFVLGCCAFAKAIEPPERNVEDNVVTSERDPKVRIELPDDVKYVGGDRWILDETADCELHAFIEADRKQIVQRLYWIQFESYLESKPNLKYQYDSSRRATIGGLEFIVDAWARASDEKATPDSDLGHFQALIKERGFKLPTGMMFVRLVHLLDEQKRKELMIIYGENLSSTGLNAADLKKGGLAEDEWKSIQKGLLERAQSKIVIRHGNEH